MENETTFKIMDANKDYGKLTTPNMETYLSAAAQLEMLKTMIVGPFEDQLKKDTGHDKDNIPSRKESIDRRIGNHMFYIEAKLTTKPKYGEVYNAMVAYVTGLKHGKLEGRKRGGVRTIDGGSYVSLEDVVTNLNTAIEENTQPSVEFSIKTSKGKKSKELTRSTLGLDYSRDYSKTEGSGAAANARDYIEARKIVEEITTVITKPFEEAVRRATGYGKDNIPSEVVYTKNPVGNVLCYAVNSPAENISYGKTIEEFKQYLKEKIEEAANIRSTTPEIRHADGKDYLSLTILDLMLAQMKGNNTATTIRQNISYLRRPKDDKIIIN